MLRPLQAWMWRDPQRRAHTLLRFAAVEADGGRDIVRAAELTADPVLRRLYLAHARDEHRHALLFQARGRALIAELATRAGAPAVAAQWLAPGERGLDDLHVESRSDPALLAFLHLSEKAAALDFSAYREVLGHDPATRGVFDEVLRDEIFHMNYTATQLARLAPAQARRLLWQARVGRLWKGLLRLMTGLAGLMGSVILTVQYFVLLPPFAWLAKRAARHEAVGWTPVAEDRAGSLDRQY